MKKTQIEKLKEFREHLNLTPTQFAATLGVSQSLMSKIETGAKPLSPKLITALKRVYNLTPDFLINDKKDYQDSNAPINTDPNKDYVIKRLEQEVITWQSKYDSVMELLTKMIDKQK